jgi:hypothetical protein
VSSVGAFITSGANKFFDGRISDFRVYNTTLSASDIKDLSDCRAHYPSITVTGGQYTFSGLQTGKNYNLYLSNISLGNATPDYTGTIQT